MRELTQEEIQQVHGGLLVQAAYAVVQLAGAATTGYAIGEGINRFNQEVSNMSLGEAIYRTVN